MPFIVNYLQESKLKNLAKDNSILISGDHNEDGARVLNEYLSSLNCNKHLIISTRCLSPADKEPTALLGSSGSP